MYDWASLSHLYKGNRSCPILLLSVASTAIVLFSSLQSQVFSSVGRCSPSLHSRSFPTSCYACYAIVTLPTHQPWQISPFTLNSSEMALTLSRAVCNIGMWQFGGQPNIYITILLPKHDPTVLKCSRHLDFCIIETLTLSLVSALIYKLHSHFMDCLPVPPCPRLERVGLFYK